jgi:hypothetical protein
MEAKGEETENPREGIQQSHIHICWKQQDSSLLFFHFSHAQFIDFIQHWL